MSSVKIGEGEAEGGSCVAQGAVGRERFAGSGTTAALPEGGSGRDGDIRTKKCP